MFKNMKIATKIALIALIGLFGLSVVMITVIPGLNKIGAEIEEIAEYQVPLVLHVSYINTGHLF